MANEEAPDLKEAINEWGWVAYEELSKSRP